MPTTLNKTSSSISHIRFAILLIAIGALFALNTFLSIPIIYKLWPLLITTLSIGFLEIFVKRKKRDQSFLSIGTYLFCFSILSFYCNFTTWNNLGFLWPLFIMFIGITFLNIYIFFNLKKINLFLGILFILISILFFILFSNNSEYWWLVLILGGISIIITEKIS